MKAGILREQIDLYDCEEEVTEFGNKETKYVFRKTVRAGIIHKQPNTRTRENDEIWFPAQKQFVVRFYVDITEKMRIKFEGKFYRIVSIDSNKYFNDKSIIAELVNE